MKTILQTNETSEANLFVKQIFGLNIFSSNGQKAEVANDPRFVFLKSIASKTSCSMHIGGIGLNDLTESLETFFGKSTETNHYIPVKIGLSGGVFYNANDNSCFFPEIAIPFWEQLIRNEGGDFQYLMECGTVALYVNTPKKLVSNLLSLLEQPFAALQVPLHPPQKDWLQAISKFSSLIVVTGHDGMDINIYSASPENFADLSVPLQNAVDEIEKSSWYQQNKDILEWDNQYEKCLVLPDTIKKLLATQKLIG